MGAEETDQRLVERVQRGDKTAFDVLVLRYQHKIVKLVNRYVHDHAEALDVTQEAFIKAYRALPRFRGDSAFYTWLYRISINTAKNHLVSASRRPIDQTVDLQDPDEYDANAKLRDMDTPEALLLSDEIKRTVESTLRDLPDELRTAITLRELEGLSYEQIAQAMDCPVGTVRSRIFRAREAIDARLKPLLD
jgi:RNA polymerase sigma-70 factor (ECF subfamily)